MNAVNVNGYVDYLVDNIMKYQIGEPILTKDLSKKIIDAYQLPPNKAKAATSVAMKRIMERQAIPNLRQYQKGIYYLTEKTVFGETEIDRNKLLAVKYMLPDDGYETGMLMLHKIGLTTLMPNERQIATNKAISNTRRDNDLDIILKKPRTRINAENKRYLQFLDILALYNAAPVDAEDPYRILGGLVQKYDLKYGNLLRLANRYYNDRVILEVAEVADKGGLDQYEIT